MGTSSSKYVVIEKMANHPERRYRSIATQTCSRRDELDRTIVELYDTKSELVATRIQLEVARADLFYKRN